MNEIIAATSREHASENTKYYALYNYFIRRHTKSAVALTFNKSISTITAWIDRYAETGTVARIQRSSHYRRFNHEHRSEWILDLYRKSLLCFLMNAPTNF